MRRPETNQTLTRPGRSGRIGMARLRERGRYDWSVVAPKIARLTASPSVLNRKRRFASHPDRLPGSLLRCWGRHTPGFCELQRSDYQSPSPCGRSRRRTRRIHGYMRRHCMPRPLRTMGIARSMQRLSYGLHNELYNPPLPPVYTTRSSLPVFQITGPGFKRSG